MMYKRIILEGKSYLMLEENLGLLQYNPFNHGEFTSKVYSDREGIHAIGVAPIETVTKKTIEGKKVEEVDSKLALKLQWNLEDLYSDSDLFLRYYRYFEDLREENKPKNDKTSTVQDFMPFVNDPAFQEILKQNDEVFDSGEDDSAMFENAGSVENSTTQNPLNETDEEDLPGVNLSGKEAQSEELQDPAVDTTQDVPEVPPTEEEELGAHIDSVDPNGADDLSGFTEPDVNPGEEGITPDLDNIESGKKFEDKKYNFYIVFKYKAEYNHHEMSKAASYHDGSKIDILKVVSEKYAPDSGRVGITGRALERAIPGFYKELVGVLNANYKKINEVAFRAAQAELEAPETVPEGV